LSGAAAAAAWAALTATFTPSTLTDDGALSGTSDSVLIDATIWVDRPFPLLRHIDIGNSLANGRWIVILHRQDCQPCRETIPVFVQLAYEFQSQPNAPRIALIEVPALAQSNRGTQPSGSLCLRGTLTEDRDWKVFTPVFFYLEDGVTKQATYSSEMMLRDVLSSVSPVNGPGEFATSRTASLLPDYRLARRLRYRNEVACGPLSLIAILKHLNFPLGTEDIEELIKSAGTSGSDMLQLQTAAEDRGLHTLGVLIMPDKLIELAQPAIVHLDGYGFAAVTDYTADGLRIVYPMRRPIILSRERFQQSFGAPGKALLMSREPLVAAKLGLADFSTPSMDSRSLRPEKSIIAVGRVYTRHWRNILKLHNESGQKIRIEDVSTEKPCTGGKILANVDSTELNPGDFVRLNTEGEQDELGGFVYRVVIRTDQPEQKELRIPVRGYVEQAILVDEPGIVLPSVNTGEQQRVEVSFDLAEGFKLEDVRVAVPEGAPIAAQIATTAGKRPRLNLTWNGAGSPGWFRYKLELRPGTDPSYAASPLFVAVQVLPRKSAFPSSLLIADDQASQSWSRKIDIEHRTESRGSFSFSWSDPAFDELLAVSDSGVDGRKQVIKIKTKDACTTATLLGKAADLRLGFRGGESLKIPVYVGKASFVRK
jgi:hypothetical protein